jgi:hypothetical protein
VFIKFKTMGFIKFKTSNGVYLTRNNTAIFWNHRTFLDEDIKIECSPGDR